MINNFILKPNVVQPGAILQLLYVQQLCLASFALYKEKSSRKRPFLFASKPRLLPEYERTEKVFHAKKKRKAQNRIEKRDEQQWKQKSRIKTLAVNLAALQNMIQKTLAT